MSSLGLGERTGCFILATISDRLQLPVFRECILPDNESSQIRGNFFPFHLGMIYYSATAIIKIGPLHFFIRILDFDPTVLLLKEASIGM